MRLANMNRLLIVGNHCKRESTLTIVSSECSRPLSGVTLYSFIHFNMNLLLFVGNHCQRESTLTIVSSECSRPLSGVTLYSFIHFNMNLGALCRESLSEGVNFNNSFFRMF